MEIIHFLTIITLIPIITLILIICIFARYVKSLDLQITCGRTKGLLLPKQLMTWAISFVLPCAPAGFPTSVRPIRRPQTLLPARPWGRARWWSQTESNLLPFDTYTNLAWCRLLWTSFCQWMPGQIANSFFVIMAIMNVISDIIVS